jgi:hypothetical protein
MLKISVALVLCVHICVSAEFGRAGPEHFHLAFVSLLADCCISHLPTHPPHTCPSTACPPYTRPSTQPVHPSPPSFQAEQQGVLRRVFWAVRRIKLGRSTLHCLRGRNPPILPSPPKHPRTYFFKQQLRFISVLLQTYTIQELVSSLLLWFSLCVATLDYSCGCNPLTSHPPVSSKTSQTIWPYRGRISSNDSFGLSRYVADLYRVSSLLTKISPPVAIRLCIVHVAASLPSSRLPQNITKPSGLTADGLL